VALLKSATPIERERVIPNHLGKSSGVRRRPHPHAELPQGHHLFVRRIDRVCGLHVDDSVTVWTSRPCKPLTASTSAVPPNSTSAGVARNYSTARSITFRRQFSCSTCHPDGHIDNIVYDIEDDGIGMGPIDNRTLRGINDMAPYKWIGINPSLKRQCGPRWPSSSPGFIPSRPTN
jgi:hypothetical protein